MSTKPDINPAALLLAVKALFSAIITMKFFSCSQDGNNVFRADRKVILDTQKGTLFLLWTSTNTQMFSPKPERIGWGWEDGKGRRALVKIYSRIKEDKMTVKAEGNKNTLGFLIYHTAGCSSMILFQLWVLWLSLPCQQLSTICSLPCLGDRIRKKVECLGWEKDSLTGKKMGEGWKGGEEKQMNTQNKWFTIGMVFIQGGKGTHRFMPQGGCGEGKRQGDRSGQRK